MRRLFLLFLISVSLNSFSQNWIGDLHPSNNTFYDLQKAFNDYWSKRPYQKGNGFNVYKRWENFWEPRVGVKGIFPAADHNSAEWNKYIHLKNRNANLRSASDSGNWVQLGPSTTSGKGQGIGRINCIAFSPSDTNVFFVGTPSGGIFKTTDFGKTWKPIGDFLPQLGVSDIAIDPTNTNLMYIATGDRDLGSLGGIQNLSGTGDSKSTGLLKSYDGGNTWQPTGLKFTISNMDFVNRIIINKNNHNSIVVATSRGIYVSNDSGATFIVKKTGYFVDIESKPNNPNVLYASQFNLSASPNAQIYRSIDAGNTWTKVSNFSGAMRINLEVTPANPLVVHAIVANLDANQKSGLMGLYKSNDSGTTWTQYIDGTIYGKNYLDTYSTADPANGGQGDYDLAFAINPKNANELFLGGVNTWKSTNGGTSWTISNFWNSYYNTTGAPIIHGDKHCLAYHPYSKSNGVIFECSDGGLNYSKNVGKAWSDLTNGMSIGQIYRIAITPQSNYLTLAGHQDNGTLVLQGKTWYDATGGDGMMCMIDYSDSNIMYSEVQYGKIYRTYDGFSTFGYSVVSDNIAGKPAGAWVTPLAMDYTDPSIIYAGYNDVYKSTDQGDSWTKISTGLTTGKTYLHSLVIAPSDYRTLYTASYYNIWKTTNGGTSWTKINGTLPSQAITYICVHPTNPKIVWVTFSEYSAGNKVYKTIDGGTTWTNISGSLPNFPANCIVYEKNNNNAVYVGMDVGIFFRNDLLSDWVFFGRKLPNVPITDMKIQYNNKKLRVGTHGRGVWESNLWSSTPPASPVASFTADDTSICQSSIIHYKNTSQNSPTTFNWIFQGGSPQNWTDSVATVSYNTPGTYNVIFYVANAGGTDSSIKNSYITVYPNPNYPTITQDTNRLTSSVAFSYQWLRNDTPIVGANSQMYNATKNGKYKVQITDSNGCSSKSVALTFVYKNLGIIDNEFIDWVSIFPNPNEGTFNLILLKNISEKYSVSLFDITGKSILEKSIESNNTNLHFDISNFSKGIYIVEIMSEHGIPNRFKVVYE